MAGICLYDNRINPLHKLKARLISLKLAVYIMLRAPGTGESPGIAACPGTTAPRTSCSPRSKCPGTLVGPGGLWGPGSKLGRRQNCGGF